MTAGAPPPGVPAPDDPAGTATYVFAVCRRVDPDGLARLPGLAEGAPVRPLAVGGLTAVVQAVPAGGFTEEAWQRRLADPAELERCARAHHRVVSAAAAFGPVVPLALATLYRGDDRARRALSEGADRFRAALDRIDGHVEWGVKVYAAPDGPVRPESAVAPRPAGGRAYLDMRRGALRAREDRHDDALRAAGTVDAELRELSAAARLLRPHGEEPAGPRRAQVLNAAYLVAADREEELARTVVGLRRRTGAVIEVSGPWVPYSFAGQV